MDAGSNMTHSEKIFYAKSDLAYWSNMLQNEYDTIVSIVRLSDKCYQVVSNYQVVKEYKSRRSARMRIKKILLDKLN
jgi:hypothetical protein